MTVRSSSWSSSASGIGQHPLKPCDHQAALVGRVLVLGRHCVVQCATLVAQRLSDFLFGLHSLLQTLAQLFLRPNLRWSRILGATLGLVPQTGGTGTKGGTEPGAWAGAGGHMGRSVEPTCTEMHTCP